LMLNYCFRIAKPMNVEKSKNPRFL
jgi:hypothetical protein